ncbi:MAG: hypothetical protein JWP89_5712 [Schlesneria sp.]|nr:hypothetical protein [Schlesneria sp.]
MPSLTRRAALFLFAASLGPGYLLCLAQGPQTPPAKKSTAVPQSLFGAGPIEPLRDMAGQVTVVLRELNSDGKRFVFGSLVGLDGHWVVVRQDFIGADEKPSEFQWIPVKNIERMVQTTVHPERLKPSSK